MPNIFGIITFKPNFLSSIKNTCFNNKYYEKNTTDSSIIKFQICIANYSKNYDRKDDYYI